MWADFFNGIVSVYIKRPRIELNKDFQYATIVENTTIAIKQKRNPHPLEHQITLTNYITLLA